MKNLLLIGLVIAMLFIIVLVVIPVSAGIDWSGADSSRDCGPYPYPGPKGPYGPCVSPYPYPDPSGPHGPQGPYPYPYPYP